MQANDDWQRRYIEGRQLGLTPPAWLASAYQRFAEQVLDPGYPCYLGSRAIREGDLYVAAAEARSLTQVASSLSTFVEVSRSLRSRRSNLALFIQPTGEFRTHSDFQQVFWSVLQHLCDHDPLPDTAPPRSPDNFLWEFPFAGQLFFVVGASPSYARRKSRNLGSGLILIFQPRDVFLSLDRGDLTQTEEPLSPAVRLKIRRRLVQWDGVEIHPHLGTYGEEENIEWKQYFIPDGEEEIVGTCPLALRPLASEDAPIILENSNAN